MGKFFRNSNRDYTSLIAKFDKNLVFDNTFNKNGIKVSPFYPDKIIYHDFIVNKNKILRIHFKGYTYEMIIMDVPEKEDKEEDGEGNSDDEKKEEKKELKINIEDHF